MKTVSILLVNSRKVSNQRRDKSAAAAATGKKRKIKMDESAGKVTPKLMDSLKKRTHFSKYSFYHVVIYAALNPPFNINFRKELTALCKIYRKLVTNCYSSTSKAGTPFGSNARQKTPAVEVKNSSDPNDAFDDNFFFIYLSW